MESELKLFHAYPLSVPYDFTAYGAIMNSETTFGVKPFVNNEL